jgi:hypothetical protein
MRGHSVCHCRNFPALLPTPIINAGHPQCRLIPNGGVTLHDPDDCVVTLRDAKAMQ